MRNARVSAMALMLAAMPARAEAQDDWWDWTLRDLTVHVDIGIGGAPARVRGVPDVVVVRPRHADDRYYEDRYYDDRYDDDYYDDDYEDRYDRRYDRKRGKGPRFCRNGAGHPVHGRRWCVAKGFGMPVYAVRWERRHWNDVWFGRPWYRARAGYVDGRILVDVVGRGVYGRLDLVRRRMGAHDALTGRWVRPRGGALVLQVRSGPRAIAELSDLNGDGRVDVVLVASI